MKTKRTPIVGLTGNIGSGKSAAALMLRELGAAVIDTDDVAREVTERGTQGLIAIVKRFGESVLDADGNLDRRVLREMVFSDSTARVDLESILHPAIMGTVVETTRKIRDLYPLVVWVVPLLFEAGLDAMVEQVWLVAADESVRLKRIMARDNMGRELALQMIQAQMPEEDKMKRSNEIIDNNGTLEQTRDQVQILWKRYVE